MRRSGTRYLGDINRCEWCEAASSGLIAGWRSAGESMVSVKLCGAIFQ